MKNSTPCKTVILKISVQNFAHIIASGAATTVQISVQIGSVGGGGFSYNAFVTFLTVLSCHVPFSRARVHVEPLDRFLPRDAMLARY